MHALLANGSSPRQSERFSRGSVNSPCLRSKNCAVASGSSLSRHLLRRPPVLRRAAHRQRAAEEARMSNLFGALRVRARRKAPCCPVERLPARSDSLSSGALCVHRGEA